MHCVCLHNSYLLFQLECFSPHLQVCFTQRGVLQDLHYTLLSYVFEIAAMHSMYRCFFFSSVYCITFDGELRSRPEEARVS